MEWPLDIRCRQTLRDDHPPPCPKRNNISASSHRLFHIVYFSPPAVPEHRIRYWHCKPCNPAKIPPCRPGLHRITSKFYCLRQNIRPSSVLRCGPASSILPVLLLRRAHSQALEVVARSPCRYLTNTMASTAAALRGPSTFLADDSNGIDLRDGGTFATRPVHDSGFCQRLEHSSSFIGREQDKRPSVWHHV